MHPTDQVVAPDVAVGHQGTPVDASAVQHRDLVVVAYDYEVDPGDQRRAVGDRR